MVKLEEIFNIDNQKMPKSVRQIFRTYELIGKSDYGVIFFGKDIGKGNFAIASTVFGSYKPFNILPSKYFIKEGTNIKVIDRLMAEYLKSGANLEEFHNTVFDDILSNTIEEERQKMYSKKLSKKTHEKIPQIKDLLDKEYKVLYTIDQLNVDKDTLLPIYTVTLVSKKHDHIIFKVLTFVYTLEYLRAVAQNKGTKIKINDRLRYETVTDVILPENILNI